MQCLLVCVDFTGLHEVFKRAAWGRELQVQYLSISWISFLRKRSPADFTLEASVVSDDTFTSNNSVQTLMHHNPSTVL